MQVKPVTEYDYLEKVKSRRLRMAVVLITDAGVSTQRGLINIRQYLL